MAFCKCKYIFLNVHILLFFKTHTLNFGKREGPRGGGSGQADGGLQKIPGFS